MTKNMTRKGLAFGAGLALIASGLASVPAQAAAGDLVGLAPSVGSKTGIFITDEFVLQTSVSSQITSGNTAFKIDNPDQDVLLITLTEDADQNGTFDALPNTVELYGITSQGVYKKVSGNQALDSNTDTDDGRFVVDMKTAGIVSLVIYDIEGVDDTAHVQIEVQPISKVTGGTREVNTVSGLPIVGTAAYELDLADVGAVTFTTLAGSTISNIATGLDDLVSAAEDYAVIQNTASNLVINYVDEGNVTTDGFTITPTPTVVLDGAVAAKQTDSFANITDAAVQTGATYAISFGGTTETHTATAGQTIAQVIAAIELLENAGDNASTMTLTEGVLTIEADAAGVEGTATSFVITPVVTQTLAGSATAADVIFANFNGVFDIGTDPAVELPYGAGDKSVTVTSWVESQALANYETVDAAYASLPQTVTWYDPKGVVVIPRVERFNSNLNDLANKLFATIEFNKPINLEMFDRTQWSFQVTTGGLPTFAGDTEALVEEEDIVGLGAAAKNADNFGRYAFDTDQTVAVNTTYTVNVHSKLAEAATGVERWYS